MKAIVHANLIYNDKVHQDSILVFDKKIVGIVEKVPSNAEVIDVKGAYVSAGFIDNFSI